MEKRARDQRRGREEIERERKRNWKKWSFCKWEEDQDQEGAGRE